MSIAFRALAPCQQNAKRFMYVTSVFATMLRSTVVAAIFQTRELRPREVKSLALGLHGQQLAGSEFKCRQSGPGARAV